MFGDGTHEAVREFQRVHGLEPTGVVDRLTVEAINTAVD
jgi:murein L,D-transpeptidase YcbB/YkuD